MEVNKCWLVAQDSSDVLENLRHEVRRDCGKYMPLLFEMTIKCECKVNIKIQDHSHH